MSCVSSRTELTENEFQHKLRIIKCSYYGAAGVNAMRRRDVHSLKYAAPFEYPLRTEALSDSENEVGKRG